MNIIAIVGRPNVGKSTLFNRLTESRNAIVDETAGVTRDRQYGHSDWNGKRFSVIDTGGYVMGGDDEFEVEIRKQVSLAIDEADVILFLVDAREGLTPMDEDVAEMLRKCPKPVVLAANKVDNSAQMDTLAEFYSLGLGDPYPIAGVTGSGTGDLLDALVKDFDSGDDDPTDGLPRIAVVGRPNVGKSSFINMITGEHRSVVTPIAGTTRDSVYSHYNLFGFDFNFVDTAGLRRKAKVSEDLEFYSVMRSIRAIENSDVCVLMLDATRGIESQDMNIVSLIVKNQKGLVVVVNKWDLIEDRSAKVMQNYEDAIRSRLAPFTDFPIVFTSAIEKQRILKVLECAKDVYKHKTNHVSTGKLNAEMLPLIEAYPPPSTKGKYIKIKYCTQLQGPQIPTFIFFANLPQYVKDPYKRFLENKIREKWDFSGTPINIFIRQK